MNLLAGEAACIRAVYGPVWVLPVFGTSVPGIVRPGRGTPMGRRTGRLMEKGTAFLGLIHGIVSFRDFIWEVPDDFAFFEAEHTGIWPPIQR